MNHTPPSPLSTSTSAHDQAVPMPPAHGRALVLGGGGSTGNAWLIGVVAGLYDAGLDVTAADLTIGTSAGATATAQLGGASPDELFAAALAAPPTRAGSAPGRPARPVSDHLDRLGRLIASAGDMAGLRRRLGASALEQEAASDGTWQAQWRTVVASRLPSQDWPRRPVLLTAVAAETGEPVTFGRDSGVDLADAVAASCASGLPYRIAGTPYIDGGYRRNENADLAAGHERVLVLSPLGGRSLHPPAWGTSLAAQVAELRERGASVETIVPDGDHEHLFGVNAMNATLRPAAAEAGRKQGRALAGRIAELWR